MIHALFWAAGGTGFTFFMTGLGAATVFLFRERASRRLHQLLLGFAAGVMIAASMWSLLIPAIEAAEEAGLPGWFPAAGGSALGVLFLAAMDAALPRLTPAFLLCPRDESGHRSALLVLAIAMHNIPEGMAVGISFALAAQSDPTLLPAALALALGIGIQNFPEGAAISLPLRQAGLSRGRAFLIGAASGAVEPAAALFTVLAAGLIQPLLPWLLSFAAGAMLYVVVEELIPEANLHRGREAHRGTFGVMAGFLIMMILDVALG